MPNPYHDETGRFCSKEEMGAAVDRVYATIAMAKNPVQLAEATDAWFELRTEFEAAQHPDSGPLGGVFPHQVNVPPLPAPAPFGPAEPALLAAPVTESWLNDYHHAAENNFENLTPSQIAALSTALQDSKTTSWGSHSQLAAEDFMNEAPAAAKAAVLRDMRDRYHTVSEEIARKFLASDFGSSREVVDAVLLNTELPTADKLTLARLHNRLALAAAHSPRLVVDGGEHERALVAELHAGVRRGDFGNEQRQGWAALAYHGTDQRVRTEILDRFVTGGYQADITQKLASSPHLSDADEKTLLTEVAAKDAVHWIGIASSLVGAAYKIKTPERKAHSAQLETAVARYSAIMWSNDADAYQPLTHKQLDMVEANLQFLKANEAELTDSQRRQQATLTATLDAQPKQYAALRAAAGPKPLRGVVIGGKDKQRLLNALRVRAAAIASAEYAAGTIDVEAAQNSPYNRLRPIR